MLGQDTQHSTVEELARQVGYVPQNPNALLFADTVAEELAFTRRAQGMPWQRRLAGTTMRGCWQTLGSVARDGRERYPRDLSAASGSGWPWPPCWSATPS